MGCNYPVTVPQEGSLEIHTEYELVKTHGDGTKTYAQKATANGNCTLTSSGAEILIHTSIGECIFTTNGTDVGTLKGGSPAVLDIESSSIPRTGGSFFCGSSGTWTGDYTVSTPKSLSLD